VFFIYFYRKNYAKHTVVSTGGLGATGVTRDALPEAGLFDDDMKVESA
jgi:hypothetical protein